MNNKLNTIDNICSIPFQPVELNILFYFVANMELSLDLNLASAANIQAEIPRDIIDGQNKARKKYIELCKQKMASHFENVLSTSTIHGIYDMYKIKDIFLKVFITLCFIASASVCFYLTVTNFIEFFSYAVLTTTSTNSDIPAECNQIL